MNNNTTKMNLKKEKEKRMKRLSKPRLTTQHTARMMGGEQIETLPGGGFHGGEQIETLPGGGFH